MTKKIFKIVVYMELFIHIAGSLSDASEYVQGYVNSNGGYTQGYIRSEANDSTYDNYSNRTSDTTDTKSDSGSTIQGIFDQKAPSNNFGL